MNIQDKLNDMKLALEGKGSENVFNKFLQEFNPSIYTSNIDSYKRVTSMVSFPYTLYIPDNDNRLFIKFNIPREVFIYKVSSNDNGGSIILPNKVRNSNKKIAMTYNNFLSLLGEYQCRYLTGVDYQDKTELYNGIVSNLYDDITIVKDNPFLERTTEEELALKLKAHLSWKKNEF